MPDKKPVNLILSNIHALSLFIHAIRRGPDRLNQCSRALNFEDTLNISESILQIIGFLIPVYFVLSMIKCT